jgi:hypothetical protein
MVEFDINKNWRFRYFEIRQSLKTTVLVIHSTKFGIEYIPAKKNVSVWHWLWRSL